MAYKKIDNIAKLSKRLKKARDAIAQILSEYGSAEALNQAYYEQLKNGGCMKKLNRDQCKLNHNKKIVKNMVEALNIQCDNRNTSPLLSPNLRTVNDTCCLHAEVTPSPNQEPSTSDSTTTSLHQLSLLVVQ